MTLKERILAALKTKYPQMGLSPKVLETMTNKIAKRVGDDETKIDSEVADAEDDLAFFQAMADQNRTLAKKVEDLTEAKEKSEEQDSDKKGGKGSEENEVDNVPKWATALIESNKTLTEKLDGFEKAEKNKTSRQKLVDKLKEMKVSESYYETFIDDREFEDDTAIEEFAQKLKSAEDKYLETNNIKKLGEAAEQKSSDSVFSKADSKDGELSASEQKFLEKNTPVVEEKK